jgi:hypothetical protein
MVFSLQSKNSIIMGVLSLIEFLKDISVYLQQFDLLILFVEFLSLELFLRLVSLLNEQFI